MPRQRASIASAFRERKLPMEEKKELLDQDERVVEIELERLRGFVNHPFKVQADSQMIELQESIKKYGILNPLIVRPRQDGTYEIISGHRRKFAAEKIGYRKVPVIIRVLKDDEAVVSMVDSNLQREMISPSEKAFAYKMKYEAIKRKAGRRKCGQVDHNLGKKSIELIGEECGDSPKQVQRYIKITELIPEMLEKVDDGSMGFTPAVQLSFLKKKEQKEMLDAMEFAQCTPSLVIFIASMILQHAFLAGRIIFTIFVSMAVAIIGAGWKAYDTEIQRNTVMVICFAVTVILGLISWKGIKAKES